jgi:hypothetical protein
MMVQTAPTAPWPAWAPAAARQTGDGWATTMTINIQGKINISRKIVVNGREYPSVEEMPSDVRRVYEQAMAGAGTALHATGESGVKAKIVFNGREYANVDTIPDDARGLYETAMEAVRAQGHVVPGAAPLKPGAAHGVPQLSMAPIEVGSGSASPASRVLAVAFVILVVLGVLYFLFQIVPLR